MDARNDDAQREPRTPKVSDLIALCRELNKHNAKYIVIGGMAVIQWGFTRATEDIDLLVESSQENQHNVFNAMRSLPDQAVNEIRSTDLDEYQVIRVADEFIVDLMAKACGMTYQDAIGEVVSITYDDVDIPVANPDLLIKMKQTMREKDNLDLMFLRKLIKKK